MMVIKLRVWIAVRQSEDYKSSRLRHWNFRTLLLTSFLSELIHQSVKHTEIKVGEGLFISEEHLKFFPTSIAWRQCHCITNGLGTTFVVFREDKMKSVGRSGTKASDVNDITMLLKYRFKGGRTVTMEEAYSLEDLAHHLSDVHIAHAIFISEN